MITPLPDNSSTKEYYKSKEIDDIYYTRILQYDDVDFFNAIVFELLLRIDGFNKIFYELYNYMININKSTQIKKNITHIYTTEEKRVFNMLYDDFLTYVNGLSDNHDTKIHKIFKKYGYLDSDIGKLLLMLKFSNFSSQDTKYTKKNLFDMINEEHVFFEYIDTDNLKEEFYKYALDTFNIDIYHSNSIVPSNSIFKIDSINVQINIFNSDEKQKQELEVLSKYIHNQRSSNKIAIEIDKYISNSKFTRVNILNHFYCYDLVTKRIKPKIILSKTKNYLENNSSKEATILRKIYHTSSQNAIKINANYISNLLLLLRDKLDTN